MMPIKTFQSSSKPRSMSLWNTCPATYLFEPCQYTEACYKRDWRGIGRFLFVWIVDRDCQKDTPPSCTVLLGLVFFAFRTIHHENPYHMKPWTQWREGATVSYRHLQFANKLVTNLDHGKSKSFWPTQFSSLRNLYVYLRTKHSFFAYKQ